MARTYTYTDAINAVRSSIGVTEEDAKAAVLCSMATNKIWFAYDWKESIKTMPTFGLIPNAQDHGAPALVIPPDFAGLRKAYLVYLGSNIPAETEIQVQKDIRETGVRGIPQVVGYEPTTNSIRFFPRIPSSYAGPMYLFRGTYKTQPVKVVPNQLNQLLPVDDKYFQAFTTGLKWAAKSLSPDTQGAAEADAAFFAQVTAMAADCGLDLGDAPLFPREPLSWGSINTGGVWGGSFFYGGF